MEKDQEFLEKVENHKGYCRLPEGLSQKLNYSDNRKDVFGVNDRWTAIKEYLSDRNIGKVTDLGGHSGFFSLSFLENKMADEAKVYDLDMEALKIGELMADSMQLDKKIKYINQAISLDFVKNLPDGDSVFCLNLIHHAGVLFDIEKVEQEGWQKYAEEWIEALRKKYKFALIGVGFKGNKPKMWNVRHYKRPMVFSKMLRKAGWDILYSANVEDISRFGAKRADGLRERPLFNKILDLFYRLIYKNKENPSRKYKYHFYILE